MTVKVFVDSNVILYARDQAAPEKRRKSIEWLAALASRESAVVSPQVINESIRAFIDKMDATAPELHTFVVAMTPWCTAPVDPQVIARAIDVRSRWLFAWWDSLIVAAALSAGCDYLLTEDLQDGQSLEGMRVIDPFLHDPGSVLPAETR